MTYYRNYNKSTCASSYYATLEETGVLVVYVDEGGKLTVLVPAKDSSSECDSS